MIAPTRTPNECELHSGTYCYLNKLRCANVMLIAACTLILTVALSHLSWQDNLWIMLGDCVKMYN